MRLAESAPKRKEREYGGGLSFCSTEEGVRLFLSRCGAGKALFVTDCRSVGRFAAFARRERTVTVVFEGDALPLFAMPDGVGGILAAGGEEVLRAARFFAEVRAVPCALFPDSGTLFGVYERSGTVTLGGQTALAALADGETFFDLSQDFCPEAAAQLLLSRLAAFEAAATEAFETGTFSPSEAEPIADADGRELVKRNAALRLAERGGAPVGEGRILVRAYASAGEPQPAARAFCELFALYAAFFEKGRPRRYFVPDYRARAQRAGVSFTELAIPTREEYARRAVVFERIRAACIEELRSIGAQRRVCGAPRPKKEGGLSRLAVLPEQGKGLSAIIRDFGLMEFF